MQGKSRKEYRRLITHRNLHHVSIISITGDRLLIVRERSYQYRRED